MPRPRSALACSHLLAAVAVAGCGDDEVDTSGVRDGFVERATAAYEDGGKSRAEDSTQGIRTTCFALDDEARDQIADVLGVDGLEDSGTFIFGSGSRKQLSCPLTTTGDGTETRVAVLVSLTDLDRDGLRDARSAEDDPPEEIEGDPGDLDEDRVLGLDTGQSVQVAYVDDGLIIGVSGSDDDLDAAEAYRALPVVVEQVERVLTSD